jgi:RNA-directed DNA polymerase
MPFWDFVSKLFGKQQPATGKAPPAPAEPGSNLRDAAPAQPVFEIRAQTYTGAESIQAGPASQQQSSPRPLPAPAREKAAARPGPMSSDFLPIGRDELATAAEEVRRTRGWMWFGRRDIIPPDSDPRTKLIDRGMLTQGMLTAEQLAEMHTVGNEYSKYADREMHLQIEAGRNAEQAVEADRALRKALKEQKKAEAAERKKRHAEEVAGRKASDIIFAGKGVSAVLNDRQSDTDTLRAADLPIMHAPVDLAVALGLPIGKLRWLCYHTEVATRIHYVQFEVTKKSGGMRMLSAPHRTLAAAQQWILANILAKLQVEGAAHGFVRGRSTVTNARRHAGKGVVVNVDLEAFFPSIGFARVRHLFRRLGYSGCVATLLALICTECPRKKVTYDGKVYFVATGPRGLPQGACTSPAVSNQIARCLDRRFSALAEKLGLAYTRYADDITFSAPKEFAAKVGYLLARVRHIAQDEGFAVNGKKTRVKRTNARQTVTGLVVNAKPGVPRKMVRRLRAILHRARTEGLEAQNRQRLPHFRAWLTGMIAYVAMVRPEAGAKLRQALAEVSK